MTFQGHHLSMDLKDEEESNISKMGEIYFRKKESR